MNILQIAFKNLKSFILNYTLIFVILLLSLTVSSITLIYVGVKIDYHTDVISDGDLFLDRIYLRNDQSNLSINDVAQRLNDYSKNNKSVKYAYGSCEGSDYMGVIITDEDKNFNDFNKSTKPMKGRFFKDNEILNGDNVCVTVGLGTEIDTVKIGENNFKVIGSYTSNGISNGYIPLNSAIKNNLIPSSYLVLYKNELSVAELKDYSKELSQLFPELKVETLMDYYSENAPVEISFENICMIAMTFVSILSCAYMYIYIIQKRVKQMYIFKICGSTSKKLTSIFICELLIILVIQLILSLIGFKMLLMPALNKYDTAFTYGFSLKYVLFAFVITVFVALIIFGILLSHYCRKNAIELKSSRKG